MSEGLTRFMAVAAVLVFCVWLAAAPNAPAAVTATPVFVQTPSLGVQNFVQGSDSAGTYKTLYTGGTNGSKCTGMWISSTDGSASHLVTVQINRSGTKYLGVSVTVPISAGNANGVPPISPMTSTAGVTNWPGLPTDSDGNTYFTLKNGSDTVVATFATSLTSSTEIDITTVCADF